MYNKDKPYSEKRIVKDLKFSKYDKKDYVRIYFDCQENWEVCLQQWKDLGKPSPGDKILFRLSPELIK